MHVYYSFLQRKGIQNYKNVFKDAYAHLQDPSLQTLDIANSFVDVEDRWHKQTNLQVHSLHDNECR